MDQTWTAVMNAPEDNPFAVLGFNTAETPHLTTDMIKKRYRVLALATHSDKCANDSAFKKVSDAWKRIEAMTPSGFLEARENPYRGRCAVLEAQLVRSEERVAAVNAAYQKLVHNQGSAYPPEAVAEIQGLMRQIRNAKNAAETSTLSDTNVAIMAMYTREKAASEDKIQAQKTVIASLKQEIQELTRYGGSTRSDHDDDWERRFDIQKRALERTSDRNVVLLEERKEMVAHIKELYAVEDHNTVHTTCMQEENSYLRSELSGMKRRRNET